MIQGSFKYANFMRGPALHLKSAILDRITSHSPSRIWTAVDFMDLGPRGAVDLALYRLVASKDIRRITRVLSASLRNQEAIHPKWTGRAIIFQRRVYLARRKSISSPTP